MPQKILVIDDEPTTVALIHTLLERRGFAVITALYAQDALRKAYQFQPDLVLLDIMMPDMDGLEVCYRLREISDVPIIFLTARSEIPDIVKGLEMGADDYIIKPYDNDELVARVRTHLRHAPGQVMAEELVFDEGKLHINLVRRDVFLNNKQIHLTAKEFDLLSVLARNAGRVITREELVRQAWASHYTGTLESLKLYVHYLRKKIEDNPDKPRYILSARGVGYRFTKL